MSYNNMSESKYSEMHYDRIWWIFISIFSIFLMFALLNFTGSPINVIRIHANLDGYQAATFKATRVVEIRRIPRLPPDYPKNWLVARQLIGELKLNSGVAETGFVAGRHLEKIYKIDDTNTPSLNGIVIGNSVKVLYNSSMHSEADRESLAVISADPSDHIAAFWVLVFKIFAFLPWHIFCGYMWITYPQRFELRKTQAIRKSFELRKLNRNRNVNE
jgi:hypothetical protein